MMSRFRIYPAVLALLLFLPTGVFNSDPGAAESRDPPGPYVLLSSVVGALVGIALIVLRRQGRDVPIPFGPYLVTAGLIALFWGQTITAKYLDSF